MFTDSTEKVQFVPAIGEVEIWKDIVGWEGKYQVSSFGRVMGVKRYVQYKSRYNKITTGLIPETLISLSGKKYIQANLYKDSKLHHCYVHILVAKSFHANPDNLSEVNHKDGNPRNNYYKNLEWNTRAQNIKHSYDIGIRKAIGLKGSFNSRSKKIYQYSKNKKLIRTWGSSGEIERELGFHRSAITKCCLGELKKSKGYIWSYSILK